MFLSALFTRLLKPDLECFQTPEKQRIYPSRAVLASPPARAIARDKGEYNMRHRPMFFGKLAMVTVVTVISAFGSTLAMAAPQVQGSAPVTVVNTPSNPVPVQGSVSVSNFPAPTQTQIVTLEGSFGEGAYPQVGNTIRALSFSTKLNADGSTEAFVIPPGTVLVVTAVDVFGAGAGADAGIQSRLFRGVAKLELFARRESEANARGRISHRYEFPTGVEVASGGVVCANSNNNDLSLFGNLYGYLKSGS
jgi:hypothetical protein